MDWEQALTIIGSVLFVIGFGFVIYKIFSLNKRVREMELSFSHFEGVFEERGRWKARQIDRK